MRPPNGLAGIVNAFGDPRPFVNDKAEWERRVLVTRELPTPLRYAYAEQPIARVRAHKLVAEDLVGALAECLGRGVPVDRLKYGGCYVWRPIRGRSTLSTHTWGIAVDLEPAENPLGRSWHDDGKMLDPRVIEVFKARGWKWGGEFGRPDAQHFQFCTGY